MSHARIQDFCWGGGGGEGWSRANCQKTVLTTFFFFISTFNFRENYFSKVLEGGPSFFQDGPPFSGGGGGGG